jgi:hypothetical protein
MLIAIIGPSRNKCIGRLVRELRSRNLSDVLVLDAQSALASKIELLGNEETAIVYSVESLTPEPLSPKDCLDLLKPLARHLHATKHPGSGPAVPMPPCHSRQRFLVPSGRTSTRVIRHRNSWVFRQ